MTEFLKSDRPLILDGAMGTVLDGMREDHTNYPERLNLSEPGTIKKIHRAYFDAGADIVCTNTFGANGLRYGSAELREIITSAVSIAKEAASESRGNGRR